MSFENNKKRNVLVALAAIFIAGGLLLTIACASSGAKPKGDQLMRIQESRHYRNGKFVNKLPAREPPFFRAMKEWVRGADHTTPEEPISVVERSRGDFARLPDSGLRITWLGHSTSLVEIDGVRILFDPIWSERSSPFSWTGPSRFFESPLALEQLPPIDAVLISHDHFDHLDKPTVKRLGPRVGRFVVPLGVGARLESFGIEPEKIFELDWWETSEVGGITVSATPARHFSGRSLVMTDRDQTLWAGFALLGPIHRVYYSGDTGMFPGFREIGQRLGPFDAALIEVGAYNRLWADLHLGPEQATRAAEQVDAKLLIPVHWATFDLALHSWTEPAERLIVAAAGSDVSLTLPRPGQSVESGDAPLLSRWWPELPWQTAEQHPIVSSGLSPDHTTSTALPAESPGTAL